MDPVYCPSCRKQINASENICPFCQESTSTAARQAKARSQPQPTNEHQIVVASVIKEKVSLPNNPYVLGEYSRQYITLRWCILSFLFWLGPLGLILIGILGLWSILISFLIVSYGIIGQLNIKRKVSELGINPKDFTNAALISFKLKSRWIILIIIILDFAFIGLRAHDSYQHYRIGGYADQSINEERDLEYRKIYGIKEESGFGTSIVDEKYYKAIAESHAEEKRLKIDNESWFSDFLRRDRIRQINP